MNVNPFDKTQFENYRDWEKSLVDFFVREAKKPSSEDWLLMVNGADSPKSVAYSALLLFNLICNKPHFSVAADMLYTVYETLDGKKSSAAEFEAWLHTNWLNVSRVANMFNAELTHH